jgi:hypothetical protein
VPAISKTPRIIDPTSAKSITLYKVFALVMQKLFKIINLLHYTCKNLTFSNAYGKLIANSIRRIRYDNEKRVSR